MNVSELYDLTHWITDEIVTTQVLQKYQTLQAIVQRNSQPNQQKQPFETQKNQLIDVLKKVPLTHLTKDQLLFLEELGIAIIIGEEGISNLEEMIYRNSLDIATLNRNLKEVIQKLTQGIQKSDQIKSGLDGCVYEEDYEADNEVLLRVHFAGNAAMKNISDFKSWGSAWYEIGRGISMAHNAAPEDVKVIGATKGSVILELAVIAGIAATTSKIILSALKVAEKVLDIRKKAEEIRSLKLQNVKLASAIEKEAENEKKSGIEEISRSMVEELNLNTEDEGDKKAALEKAIKNLVNFVEKGGEVDFVIPEEEESVEDGSDMMNQEPKYKDLRVTFEKIRLLENKVKLLEAEIVK